MTIGSTEPTANSRHGHTQGHKQSRGMPGHISNAGRAGAGNDYRREKITAKLIRRVSERLPGYCLSNRATYASNVMSSSGSETTASVDAEAANPATSMSSHMRERLSCSSLVLLFF